MRGLSTPVHPSEKIIEGLLTGSGRHLTGGKGGEVCFRPVGLDALPVRTPNSGAIIESKLGVATFAVCRKMELGYEEDYFGHLRVNTKVDVEVLHSVEKIKGKLTCDVVRNDNTPPIRMSESDRME